MCNILKHNSGAAYGVSIKTALALSFAGLLMLVGVVCMLDKLFN